MSGRMSFGWLALTALLASGCLESKTVLTVRKDGSGTIEQVAYYKPMDFGFGGKTKPGPQDELKKLKEDCAKAAQEISEGAKVESVEILEPRGEWKGARVVYAFPDVSKIRMTWAPPVAGIKGGEREQMRFQFAKGDSPKLTVLMPPMTPPGDGGKAGDDKDPDPAMLAMMGQMLDGFRIELRLKVEGTISKTNATYVNKARDTVGLGQQNLGGLFKDPAVLEKLKGMAKIKDPKVAKEKLQDPDIRKYIKFDPAEKVEIEFQ